MQNVIQTTGLKAPSTGHYHYSARNCTASQDSSWPCPGLFIQFILKLTPEKKTPKTNQNKIRWLNEKLNILI